MLVLVSDAGETFDTEPLVMRVAVVLDVSFVGVGQGIPSVVTNSTGAHALGDYHELDRDHGARRPFDGGADEVVDPDRIEAGGNDVGVGGFRAGFQCDHAPVPLLDRDAVVVNPVTTPRTRGGASAKAGEAASSATAAASSHRRNAAAWSPSKRSNWSGAFDA
jgi:hypothetical protein